MMIPAIPKETILAIILIVIAIYGIIKCTNFVTRGLFILLCIYAGNLIASRYFGFDIFLYLKQLVSLQV